MPNNWTREQTIVALNVYCKIPFKNSSARHPLIKEYAQIIGRTPAALNLKIGNLGSFDPALRAKGIVGLGHTSNMDDFSPSDSTYFYNRNDVEDYLYNNTRFERGSRSRHHFGSLYRGEDGKVYIKLNLQIRFCK